MRVIITCPSLSLSSAYKRSAIAGYHQNWNQQKMKFHRIFTAFLAIAVSSMVEGLPRNVNGKKAPAKSLSSQAGMIPQRFCTHQNCRNCHQGINTIFSKSSSSNRVCKLLIVSPKCCFEYMWNPGHFFWADLNIFNQTANSVTIYFPYFV